MQGEEVIKATNRSFWIYGFILNLHGFCYRFDVEDYKKSYIGYNAIMLLRILWLKDNNKDAWKLIDKQLDNLEHQNVEDKNMRSVIDFIHNHCKLIQFTAQEIRHIMGKKLF